jgi:hypothetical protein
MENTRRNALFEINKIMDTEVYGASVGKPVKDKIEVANNYRFILAFENSISQGYVTEKLLEAQLTNAFPLYWGPKKIDYFNSERYLNFRNFNGLSDFLEEIRRLDQNPEELIHKLSQPVLSEKFDFDSVIHKLRESLL